MNRKRAASLGVLVVLAATLTLIFASISAATNATRDTAVSVTGTVTGIGGSGARSWTMPVSGARIECADLTSSVTSLASGEYILGLLIPSGTAPDSLSVVASATYFQAGQYTPTAQADQVKDFLLQVQDTELTVKVVHNGKALRNAKVTIFGLKRMTNASGEAEFSSLELKPSTKYPCAVKKGGYDRRTVQVMSKPGGVRSVVVSLRH